MYGCLSWEMRIFTFDFIKCEPLCMGTCGGRFRRVLSIKSSVFQAKSLHIKNYLAWPGATSELCVTTKTTEMRK